MRDVRKLSTLSDDCASLFRIQPLSEDVEFELIPAALAVLCFRT